MRLISISSDFTRYPGGRFASKGPGSGEELRQRFLEPILREGLHAQINLDGVAGYPVSFLEEAFGGLVRAGYSAKQISDAFSFVATGENEVFVKLIYQFIAQAKSTHPLHS